jgi:hypothetical protein
MVFAGYIGGSPIERRSRKCAVAACLCSLFLLLSYHPKASAAELSDSLLAASADKFAGFYYRLYKLTGAPGDKMRITLISKKFDPYIMLIRPDGSVLTNDDYESKTDAQIEVDNPSDGSWLLVATTSSEQEEGAYKLDYERLSMLESVPPADAERKKLSLLFLLAALQTHERVSTNWSNNLRFARSG